MQGEWHPQTSEYNAGVCVAGGRSGGVRGCHDTGCLRYQAEALWGDSGQMIRASGLGPAD